MEPLSRQTKMPKETFPPPDVKEKKKKKLRFCSFVKTKEQRWQRTSRLGETVLTFHFKGGLWKFHPLIFDISEATI